ncbi:MAG: nucleotide pyrophosphohydrolase [Cephaloticoccus sp.]|nr:nucleotide pyrophosphohydrolase [Cephaloticoccus sp.]
MQLKDEITTLAQLKNLSANFTKERDWEQFHAPKNLCMAMAAEVGELMEHYLWLTVEESSSLTANPDKKTQIEEELADVFLFSLQFANMTGIDIAAAIEAKVAKNASKYPVSKAKGRADKYTDL